MSFSLIVEDTFYKKVEVDSGGQWVNGIWFPGTITVTYEPFEGLTDGYQKGKSTLIGPDGLSNDRMEILYTDVSLKTAQSLDGDSNLADIVVLEDPVLNPNTPEFTVWDRSKMNRNRGFTLIEGDSPEYLLVRENRT